MPSSEDARAAARMAVNSVRDRDPSLLVAFGADLGDALEQQLFFALRDGRSAATGAARAWVEARSAVRTAVAVAGSTLPRAPRVELGAVVVLVREPIHLAALRSVERELTERDGPHVVALLVGRAAALRRPDGPRSVRLERLLHPALGSELLRFHARGLRRLRPATESWDDLLGRLEAQRLRRVAGEEVPRIGLAAFALASAIRQLEPSLIGAFDEVGTWARILPALGRAYDTPSLDIPHAEAADAEAIRGAGYDRMAVYGPRAAAVLRAAGIGDERIVQVGAPRFDALARSYPASSAPVTPPRVLFAAQYVAGALTADALRICFAGALAAAARLAPSELVVRAHPAEPPGTIAAMVAEVSPPEGVTVQIDVSRSLHDLLDGAWLLVTAWSNSVLEAAVMGVPSLAVVPADVADPVNFAAEGLAIRAASAGEAADAAEHLRDVGERTRAVERARAALAAHIGLPDGLASSRVADLMISMATPGDQDAA